MHPLVGDGVHAVQPDSDSKPNRNQKQPRPKERTVGQTNRYGDEQSVDADGLQDQPQRDPFMGGVETRFCDAMSHRGSSFDARHVGVVQRTDGGQRRDQATRHFDLQVPLSR